MGFKCSGAELLCALKRIFPENKSPDTCCQEIYMAIIEAVLAARRYKGCSKEGCCQEGSSE